MAKVIIMRGIPGSGKSTVGAGLAGAGIKVSADDFFMVNGEYQFNPAQISAAHADCFRRFLACLAHGVDTVVVDNTNLATWECSPYVLAANAFGYEVEIVNVKCDAAVAYARQTHGVPAMAHARMAATLASEQLLPWWKQTDVTTE